MLVHAATGTLPSLEPSPHTLCRSTNRNAGLHTARWCKAFTYKPDVSASLTAPATTLPLPVHAVKPHPCLHNQRSSLLHTALLLHLPRPPYLPLRPQQLGPGGQQRGIPIPIRIRTRTRIRSLPSHRLSLSLACARLLALRLPLLLTHTS